MIFDRNIFLYKGMKKNLFFKKENFYYILKLIYIYIYLFYITFLFKFFLTERNNKVLKKMSLKSTKYENAFSLLFLGCLNSS